MATPVPDIDAFEERAAILQYEAGMSRKQAEDQAAQVQGFRDATHYRQVLADYLLTGRL
ncbi:hypothetical protein OEZ71_17870 [Defluviimonas sp. WL0050]|uniref:Uncharacterized protein n=1 Tax=Albidovulum litorale TaxID=2984134 RepID=A0ABT2ZT16_9RHOB|nr:hypothetical protein [Defluviimonas sp. WL0050]MCV2874169.1 hypothetical protein [Defluviimonas sp. WL0050]